MEIDMNRNQMNILRIDSSARYEGSFSRQLADAAIANFPQAEVITRDLSAEPIPQIDENWVGANFTPADQRTETQSDIQSMSEKLVGEIEEADLILIAIPVYNFGIPAALKAWVDQVARAGRTFRYTENGPEGLLKGKKAVLLVASGGTEVDSAIDFATPYMRHVLGFIGITDVSVIAADRLMPEPHRFQEALAVVSNLDQTCLLYTSDAADE